MSIGSYLDCDVCSYAPFADDTERNFRQRLRYEAKLEGWKRVRRDGRVLDVCASCAKDVATTESEPS